MSATTPLILVTGATGFVGSHLVRRLVAEGERVRIFRRDGARLEDLAAVRCEEVIGDLTDAAAVDRAVQGCEVVFHSAAVIQYWTPNNPRQYAVNVNGTRHVVEASLRHRVKRLVHVSSIAAIGYRLDGELADESTRYNYGPFRNHYCDTKYAAEAIVRAEIDRGLDAVIVNPGTVYGPGDRRRISFIRGLMSNFTARGGIAVVDIDDVIEGLIRAWRTGKTGERYVLTAENRTYREIGQTFARLIGRRGPRYVLPGGIVRALAVLSDVWSRVTRRPPTLTPSMARLANVRAFFSNAKARRELGMTFRPFAATAERTIAWYRQNRLL
ncbi:MAG: SDR family oxidoreductase [Deltaproteobacteria bacterium]|nr:SDR family oxidoreductase [Deltaproteobacteria bacterium]